MSSEAVTKALEKAVIPEKKAVYESFFKTGKGQYGEGDVFLGVNMPSQRSIAKAFVHLSLSEVEKLLDSAVHEHRMTGLLILTYQYAKADAEKKEVIYQFYLAHKKAVNNWDLVDVTTPNIVGEYLVGKDHSILYDLTLSPRLWDRRIAVLACYAFIKRNTFSDILQIAQLLLEDKEDLMHKAVGWMLREVGKRDIRVLNGFLEQYSTVMPRTMLRYAIEKHPETERKAWLARSIEERT